jgi:predicted amidohydrolase YtcJ
MTPDRVLVNGRIWTGDPRRPEAEAVAIWREWIVAVGDTEEIRRLAGPRTALLDLDGRRVLPGFHDSHLHFPQSGPQFPRAWLKEVADEAAFGEHLRALDRQLPPGHWLLGGGWDHDRTFGGQLPTAALLDRYVSNRPVFLTRYDGHSAVVNSLVLQQAGITANTPDPAGGEIVRDPLTGQPTGVLRDRAMGLVAPLIPAAPAEERAAAIEYSLQEARRMGVTSMEAMLGGEAEECADLLRACQQWEREGRLTARIGFYWPLEDWKALAHLGIAGNFGGDRLRLRGVKGFLDGSLGSSTAWFWEPYLHEPTHCGLPVVDLAKLREDLLGADRAGLQVAIHAIGDRAVSELLDLYAEVAVENGPRDRRWRVEHAQHLRPVDLDRFQALGVIASMQPYHAIDDGGWAEGRIGADRCRWSYAWRSLLDRGATVCFGSDWSVAPLSPLAGIDAAVNRRTLDGKHPHGWFPEQRIRVDQALHAYTWAAAQATFMEQERGALRPGYRADLVVLSQDLLEAENQDRIAETEVVLTLVGGEIVYTAPQW